MSPLLLALACADPAPLSTLQPATAGPLRLVEVLDEAQIEPGPLVLPAGAALDGSFRLASGWEQVPGTRVWTRPSPLRLAHDHYREEPPGVSLLAEDGRPLPWSPGLADGGTQTGGWEYVEGALYLAAARDPGEKPPTLRSSAAAAELARLDPARSGLPPAAHVRHTLTLGSMTRDSLMLSPGGSLQFTLALPAGAPRLRFGLGQVDPRILGWTGEAALRIELDGHEIFTATAATGAPFTEHSVDLSPWAGQTLTLRLEADPKGDPTGDLLALGTPEITNAQAPADEADRIVVIGLDTLRVDHLSGAGYRRDTSPHLDALAAQSTVFSHTWTVAPRTRPAFRSIFTGRWPLPALTAPNMAETFAAAGWSTAGFVANVHLIPRLGFADGYRWWEYEDSVPAAHQVDRTLSWLTDHAAEDALVFVHFMDPHVFYLPPEPYKDRYTAGLATTDLPERYNRWLVRRWEAEGRLTADHKALIEARYDAEIAYLDAQIGRLLAALNALPGRTTVVVTTDHGEEFWEHGQFEHNHTLHEELVRALLWVRTPDKVGRTLSAPASLVDIAPTLLELAGLPPLAEVDGQSLAPFVQRGADPVLEARLRERPLPLGHMMFAPEHWGVVSAGHKYILHTVSGEEQLYNLTTDPAEATDLAATADLAPFRAALSTATGWPVGPGWRIHLKGATSPFRLRFDRPVQAFLLDPEAAQDRRANLEWGEIPPVLPADVGRVQLSEEGRALTFVPGPKGEGTLALLGLPPEAEVTVQQERGVGPLRPGRVELGGAKADVVPGTLILPQDTEARRLAAQHDPEAIEALRALGYVE